MVQSVKFLFEQDKFYKMQQNFDEMGGKTMIR